MKHAIKHAKRLATMKSFSPKRLVVALATTCVLASATAPAFAGPHGGGWGRGGGWGHGGWGAGWVVGSALALTTAGLIVAASTPNVAYYGPGYYAPPVYAAPVYAAPAYAAAPVYAAPTYAAPAPAPAPSSTLMAQTSAAGRQSCVRWAMDQSGLDPSNITPYTTSVMVDSYNRAFDSCISAASTAKPRG